MDRKKLRSLTFGVALQLATKEPCEETTAVMTSFDDSAKELEEQVKKLIIDDKIANDRYNKEQMKFRKRFHK